MDEQAQSESLWYHSGLRFECTRCGNCCRGPGYVWVDEEEISSLAKHFDMEDEIFTAVYTRKVGRSRSLREQANDDCIFYDKEQGCLVYDVRPRQCRTWPFWEQNLETLKDWKGVQSRCPGSGQGTLFSVAEITARLASMKRK